MSQLDNIKAWTELRCDWRRQYERQLIYTTGENWFVVQPILGSRMAEEEEEEEEEQEV